MAKPSSNSSRFGVSKRSESWTAIQRADHRRFNRRRLHQGRQHAGEALVPAGCSGEFAGHGLPKPCRSRDDCSGTNGRFQLAAAPCDTGSPNIVSVSTSIAPARSPSSGFMSWSASAAV
jgi:hypothetical protein